MLRLPLWGTPEIDLFANRHAQFCKFVSWKPDPASCFVDAFTITWNSLYMYLHAFPPFCKIHRCLQKMLEEQRPQGITILPLWPTQVWWPELVKMLRKCSFSLFSAGQLVSKTWLRIFSVQRLATFHTHALSQFRLQHSQNVY